MKTMTALLITSLITLLFTMQNCSPTEPPPIIGAVDTLSLTLKSTSHTSVVLSLTTTANNNNEDIIILNRIGTNEDVVIYTVPLVKLETVIVDDNNGLGLNIDTEYKYQAVLKRRSDNKIVSESNVVIAKTKFAVGQEFTWEEYSIGEWQSVFSDVWGVDENNVYITGYIKMDSLLYGFLKWNGTELELISEIGGIGIYGFSNSDIWIVGGAVQHYDGLNWERKDGYSKDHQGYPLDTVLYNNTPFHAVWGTNSGNLYLVGATRKIIHWNGQKSSIMYDENNINLTEIHGYDEDFMMATGTNGVPPSTVLKYEGGKWDVFDGLDYDRIYSGCYVVSPKEYFICGAKVHRFYNNEWQEVVGDSLGMKIDIKGDKNTGEIVVVGRVNTVLHWNGISWKNIGKNISNEINNLQSVYVTNGKIFAVGTNGVTAKLFIGTRK